MAKRKRENNEKQNEKRIKEGRGQGDFENYKPWLKIQDVASQGVVTRIKGVKSSRTHHTLSTLELDFLFLLDWSENIVEVKEQYPLDLNETTALAKEVDLIHPPRSNPNRPIVITTDFLIIIRHPLGTREIARTVKYSSDLTDSRVLEKFEIERLFWLERNIDWGIVTELDINKTVVQNIRWLYKHRSLNSLPNSVNAELISPMSDFMLPALKAKQLALRTITKKCDEHFSLASGSSLSIVRYLLAIRQWQVNMFIPIQPGKPLALITADGGKEI